MTSITCLKETANIPGHFGTLYFLLGILLPLILVSSQDLSTSTSSIVGTESVTSVNPTTDATQQPTGNTAGTATLVLHSTSAGIATSVTSESATTTGNTVSPTDTTVTSSTKWSLITNTSTGDASTITTTQPLTSIKSTGGSSSTTTTLPLSATSTPTGTAITTHSTTAMMNSSNVAKPQSLTTTAASGDPATTTTQSTATSTNSASTATIQSTTTSNNPARTSTVTTISVVSLTTSSMSSGPITVPTNSSSVPSTYTMSSNSLNSTSFLSVTNVTTESIGPMGMISCPAFTCNYSDCYTMYNNENATTCTTTAYCELTRQEDLGYTVNCTTTCDNSCVNASSNCSVKCCNSTGCLNDTFVSMMMGTITEQVTSNAPDTTPAITSTTPTMDNSNKCHTGTCTGATCYTDFTKNQPQRCSASQAHCQLKKETRNSNTQWTAGCTTNCSGKTTCKAATPPPCYLECCNTTQTSCLWLNGTLNVLSSAERIFHLNTELIASLMCVLAIALVIID